MNRHVVNRVSSALSAELRRLNCGGDKSMDAIKAGHYRRLSQMLRPGGDPLLVVSDVSPVRRYIDEAGYGLEWDDCVESAPSMAIAISKFLAVVRRDRDHDSDVFDVADFDLEIDLPAAGRSLDIFT